jgi:Protein kinase domain
MAKCANCLNDLAAGGHFCAFCGSEAAVDAMATQTVANTTPRQASSSRGSSRSSSSSSSSSGSRSAQGRFASGELLGGRYRIVAMLGRGGMGEVYRADDLSLDQAVALKFLPEAFTHNPEALERFRNEVRIARQVSHPNVCRVYDLAEMEGLYFLSMEYVDGEDLGSLLRRIGRLPGDKALEISRKLCAGLAAAHEKGVLHRDLKPANIMLDGRGQVILTDFGLAGLAGEIKGLEVRNGTPAYMAPEQLAGEEVSVKSDIYSLGLVLYELFTGKLPFESGSSSAADRIRTLRESTPVTPSTIVGDLDQAVERVILRCLSPKPANRPASALSVAAALPGGDPLAAALAAGETPSPEMVAAAGLGEGLAPWIASLLLLAVIIGLPLALGLRSSALFDVDPEYPPEVLAQKSRDIAGQLGAGKRPADESYSFEWDYGLFEWFSRQPGRRNWHDVLVQNPQALRFQYRSHVTNLAGMMIHDDLMTPGLITWDDTPFEESGMIRMRLDSKGRLTYFERIPDQRQQAVPSKQTAEIDWNILFAAAGLELADFQLADPLWTSLGTSDTRAAWTRTAPRSQRVEAATLRGQPVFFAVIEPWTKPDRVPEGSDSSSVTVTVLAALFLVVLVAALLMATSNIRRQRGDRRGGMRLAGFVFCVQMILWAARSHMTPSLGTFGIFLLALATATFYGAVVWTMYIALEPHVRRRWPQALISWSAVLIGRFQDSVVGRDVLIGCAAGAILGVLNGLSETWLRNAGGWPHLDNTLPLIGARGYLSQVIMTIPHSIRGALIFLFLIFLLRVLLRNQWIAGAAFAMIFAALELFGGSHPLFNAMITFLAFATFALLVLRWGLMSLGTAQMVLSLTTLPLGRPSMWYFGGMVAALLCTAALAAWAFHNSLGGRRLWRDDFFG